MFFGKKQTTDSLTNFCSYTCQKYKPGLIKTLIDRAYNINSTWKSFDRDINDVKNILQKMNTLKKHNTNIDNIGTDDKKLYFKLPYIGQIATYTANKLNEITQQFCKKGFSIKIAFTPTKLSSYFSLKDKRLDELKSYVVYKCLCTGCNASYLGHTTTYFTTRIKQHLESDKKSHIFKHLKGSVSCKEVCCNRSFEIIDSAQTQYSLKLKEAMWIRWLRPSLNIQKKYTLTLALNI